MYRRGSLAQFIPGLRDPPEVDFLGNQYCFPETDPAYLHHYGHDKLLHQNVFGIRPSEGPRPKGIKDFSRLLPRITGSNGDRERS